MESPDSLKQTKGKAKGKKESVGKQKKGEEGEEEEVSRGKVSPAANEEACFCVALFPFRGKGRRAKVERVSVSQAWKCEDSN